MSNRQWIDWVHGEEKPPSSVYEKPPQPEVEKPKAKYPKKGRKPAKEPSPSEPED